MGLLDGGLAQAFAGVFNGIYLDGQLYRPNAGGDDGQGGGSGNGFAPAQAVKVQIDAVTEAMRASDGYVEGDVRILMLAFNVAAPNTDCEIAGGGKTYLIESVATDPAGTYYELRGRKKG